MFQFGNAEQTYFIAPTRTQDIIMKYLDDEDYFIQLDIGLNSDLVQIKRKTGSLLDLLSACGGLFRAFNVIGEGLINPYTLYALKAHLALHLVRYIPSKNSKNDKRNTV